METDRRSGGAGKGSLEELMRERIRATIEAMVDEELEAALGASGRFEQRQVDRAGCRVALKHHPGFDPSPPKPHRKISD